MKPPHHLIVTAKLLSRDGCLVNIVDQTAKPLRLRYYTILEHKPWVIRRGLEVNITVT